MVLLLSCSPAPLKYEEAEQSLPFVIRTGASHSQAGCNDGKTVTQLLQSADKSKSDRQSPMTIMTFLGDIFSQTENSCYWGESLQRKPMQPEDYFPFIIVLIM